MASINFELGELVDILKRSTKIPNQIKQIHCENDSICITISPGKLSPTFNVFLTYDKFYNGKVMFNLNCKGPAKLVISILDNIGFRVNKNIYDINGKQFTLDINDYLKEKFDFVEVKDIINKNNKFSIIL